MIKTGVIILSNEYSKVTIPIVTSTKTKLLSQKKEF